MAAGPLGDRSEEAGEAGPPSGGPVASEPEAEDVLRGDGHQATLVDHGHMLGAAAPDGGADLPALADRAGRAGGSVCDRLDVQHA